MKTYDPASAVASEPRSRKFVAVEPLEPRQFLSASTTVTVTTHKNQTIDGFGTSLGGKTDMSLASNTTFQKNYYQDLGSSMFRVALNPWLLRGKTHTGKLSIAAPVVLGSSLKKNIELFDFSQINVAEYGSMAEAAKKYGSEVKLIGSVWSPPFWMKGTEVSAFDGQSVGREPTYNDATGNTSGGSLIMTEANLTQFGRYVAAYVAGFEKAFGVTLDAISLQNEPAFHEGYSSCVYDPTRYVKALEAVHHWFDVYGLKTELIGPEDVGVGSTANKGPLQRQMAYVKAIDAAGDASDLAGYAIHGYADDGQGQGMRSPEMWENYVNGMTGRSDYAKFDGIGTDKPSWMTEASGFTDSWADSLRLAGSIQDAMVYGNVSAYVYWGISNKTSNGEALTTGTDTTSNRYETFKHFSAFVRPGAQRLTTRGGDPDGVYVSAFRDGSAHTLTAVAINEADKKEILHLNVAGLNLAQFDYGYVSTADTPWQKLKPVAVVDGVATLAMPAGSIFTLVAKTNEVAPGAVSGVYFDDKNRDGAKDDGESGFAGDKVFLDLNHDDVREAKEPYAVTDAGGDFTITGVAPGAYRVRREIPDGYAWTTARPTVTVAAGKTTTGVSLGIVQPGKATTPTAPTTPSKSTAALSGHAFADTDGDGKQDPGEGDAFGKTVYLDANNDGVLDDGEKSVKTDSDGDFAFAGLAAGTVHVRRVFTAGYTSSTARIDVKLTAGEKKTGLLIGSRTV